MKKRILAVILCAVLTFSVGAVAASACGNGVEKVGCIEQGCDKFDKCDKCDFDRCDFGWFECEDCGWKGCASEIPCLFDFFCDFDWPEYIRDCTFEWGEFLYDFDFDWDDFEWGCPHCGHEHHWHPCDPKDPCHPTKPSCPTEPSVEPTEPSVDPGESSEEPTESSVDPTQTTDSPVDTGDAADVGMWAALFTVCVAGSAVLFMKKRA